MAKNSLEKPISDQIMLVTGANAGIGFATSMRLATQGATVVLLCRSQERARAAIEQIREQTGNNNVHSLLVDLASQESIQQGAAEFQTRFPRLNVLVNNAAIIPPQRSETADRLEMQFAVNYLAPYHLTHLLLDQLKASSPARIVNLTSQVHSRGRIQFDNLQSTGVYIPSQVYANTKLMMILYTYELSRRLEGSGVTVNCVHPGTVDTALLADYMGQRRGQTGWGLPPDEGAEPVIYLATSPEVAGTSGEYFRNGRSVRSADVTYDEALARQLWDESLKLLNLA
jgi:NAD(P)-dependent dehydrogenase (short-subunit alcohol dehydrogenase family)